MRQKTTGRAKKEKNTIGEVKALPSSPGKNSASGQSGTGNHGKGFLFFLIYKNVSVIRSDKLNQCV